MAWKMGDVWCIELVCGICQKMIGAYTVCNMIKRELNKKDVQVTLLGQICRKCIKKKYDGNLNKFYNEKAPKDFDYYLEYFKNQIEYYQKKLKEMQENENGEF